MKGKLCGPAKKRQGCARNKQQRRSKIAAVEETGDSDEASSIESAYGFKGEEDKEKKKKTDSRS